MSNRKAKFCFNTMVKNEAPTILRMLNSVYKYIDYWVIQDNGSTDGTQDIINNFFQEKNIPGFLYQLDWWEGHGVNRDHTVQTALKADHGCDWILRVDADEELHVDEDFDWSIFEDTSIQSFNVTAKQGAIFYQRCWLWNAKFNWRFYPDKAHERIYLESVGEDFQRVSLSAKFRHVVSADGMTWADPMKFLKDALNLEIQQVPTRLILEDRYHFWYIGKSYSDCYTYNDFPLKSAHSKEYARRCIFYFEQFMETKDANWYTNMNVQIDEMAYMGLHFMARAYRFLGDLDKSIELCQISEKYCPERNEHFVVMAEIYQSKQDWKNMYNVISVAASPTRKNPFPQCVFMINTELYSDTGKYVTNLFEIAKSNLSKKEFPGVSTW